LQFGLHIAMEPLKYFRQSYYLVKMLKCDRRDVTSRIATYTWNKPVTSLDIAGRVPSNITDFNAHSYSGSDLIPSSASDPLYPFAYVLPA
jgi:hypothetical protein